MKLLIIQINKIITKLPIQKSYIKDLLIKNSNRLVFLLWGKDNDYEGPLFNVYEENEWFPITILISNWLLEIIDKIKKNKKFIENDLNEYLTRQNLSNIGICILKQIIQNNMIKDINNNKVLQQINVYEQSYMVRELLETTIETIVTEISGLVKTHCCSKQKTEKIVKQKSLELGKMSKLTNQNSKVQKLINGNTELVLTDIIPSKSILLQEIQL